MFDPFLYNFKSSKNFNIQFFLLRNDKKLNCTINKKKVPTILHICVTKIIARNCSIIS